MYSNRVPYSSAIPTLKIWPISSFITKVQREHPQTHSCKSPPPPLPMATGESYKFNMLAGQEHNYTEIINKRLWSGNYRLDRSNWRTASGDTCRRPEKKIIHKCLEWVLKRTVSRGWDRLQVIQMCKSVLEQVPLGVSYWFSCSNDL